MRKILILQLLFIQCIVFAQVPDLRFEQISTIDGLSGNNVKCFYQDKEGFLWIGTQNGLNRYDGKHFEIFRNNPDNKNSLSGNQVVSVLQDHDGIFWIATKDGGLTRYDPHASAPNQFRQFIHNPTDKNSIATNRLNCLYDYSNDYLLIGAEEFPGIFLNKKNFSFSYYKYPSKNFSPATATALPDVRENWIHQVSDGPGNTMLVGFLYPARVFSVPKSSGDFNMSVTLKGSGLSMPCFYADGDTIWTGSWANGLFYEEMNLALENKYDSTRQGKFADVNDLVNSITSFNEQWLMLSTRSKGIYLVNKKSREIVAYKKKEGDENSLCSNRVNCIYKDRSSTLWIGTQNGISKYDPSNWQFGVDHLNASSDVDLTIFGMNEDNDGTLRACTSDGIYKWKKNDTEYTHIPLNFAGVNLAATLIQPMQDGRYFLGTESYIYYYHPESETIDSVNFTAYAFPAAAFYGGSLLQVRSILPDTINHHPGIWVGLLGEGIHFVDFSTRLVFRGQNFLNQANSLGNNLVRKLLLDHAGNLWVATSGGLFRLKQKSIPLENNFIAYLSVPGDSTSISGNDIRDIIEDEDQNLWLATNGGGLNKFDGKRFYHYRGALSPAMFSLMFDQGHRLWIATSSGFEIFNTASKEFLHVRVNDGKDYTIPSSCFMKKKDGSFCIASENNIIYFNPDSIYLDKLQPQIYLSDLLILNQSRPELEYEKSFVLPYNQNFITFHFSSVKLSNAHAIRYEYKLEGLDKTWVEADEEGKATYTSLPAGSYTFWVRSTNAVGEWGKDNQVISFVITPPYWRTWWFYLLCVTVISSIIYLLFRFRLKQLMRLQEVRHRIATDLHDDVGSALSSISISSQLAKKFSSQEDEKVNKILNLINNTSRETLESMSDIVWAINPKNDLGKNMVLKMQRVATDLLESKGIKVNFKSQELFETMKLGMEGRKNLFLIFKEAINNISRHAGCDEVTITLRLHDNQLLMKIEDDGKGFVVTKSAFGNGMDSMKHRANQIGGILRIESNAEKGTKVILDVDLTKIRD